MSTFPEAKSLFCPVFQLAENERFHFLRASHNANIVTRKEVISSMRWTWRCTARAHHLRVERADDLTVNDIELKTDEMR